MGNHEIWDDCDAEGLLASFAYLKKFGVSDKQLIYKFDFQECDSFSFGQANTTTASLLGWGATRPAYEEQMTQLKSWLDDATSKG